MSLFSNFLGRGKDLLLDQPESPFVKNFGEFRTPVAAVGVSYEGIERRWFVVTEDMTLKIRYASDQSDFPLQDDLIALKDLEFYLSLAMSNEDVWSFNEFSFQMRDCVIKDLKDISGIMDDGRRLEPASYLVRVSDDAKLGTSSLNLLDSYESFFKVIKEPNGVFYTTDPSQKNTKNRTLSFLITSDWLWTPHGDNAGRMKFNHACLGYLLELAHLNYLEKKHGTTLRKPDVREYLEPFIHSLADKSSPKKAPDVKPFVSTKVLESTSKSSEPTSSYNSLPLRQVETSSPMPEQNFINLHREITGEEDHKHRFGLNEHYGYAPVRYDDVPVDGYGWVCFRKFKQNNRERLSVLNLDMSVSSEYYRAYATIYPVLLYVEMSTGSPKLRAVFESVDDVGFILRTGETEKHVKVTAEGYKYLHNIADDCSEFLTFLDADLRGVATLISDSVSIQYKVGSIVEELKLKKDDKVVFLYFKDSY